MGKFQFAGELQGRNDICVARYGTKISGLTSRAAGWQGCIETRIWHNSDKGCDRFQVWIVPWMHGGGKKTLLAEGILDARIEDAFIVPALFA